MAEEKEEVVDKKAEEKQRKKEGRGRDQLQIFDCISNLLPPSHINSQNEKKGNINASGKKRLISINKPAKEPNHRVLTTGATERYVFRSRILKTPLSVFVIVILL